MKKLHKFKHEHNKLANIFLHPLFLKILISVNFLGSLYGYYWYKEQLANTPWIFWIFTPDSPLATTLFVIMLLQLLKGKSNIYLNFLANVSLIKYGIWAMFVNTHYWLISGRILGQEVMLWVSHLGMALEGLLYLLLFRPSFKVWFIIGIWLIFNDYVDYSWNLHPYLYEIQQLGIVKYFTYGLTSFLLIVTGYLVRQNKLRRKS